MAKLDVKELKGLKNADFYPSHYFTEALADDARKHKFDGKLVKDRRKDLSDAVSLISEKDPSMTEAARQQLMTDWYKILGYYDKKGEADSEFKFVVRGKEYSLPIERRFDLRGEGQLWILRDSEGAIESSDQEENNTATREYFYQNMVAVQHKKSTEYLPWKEVIDQIFDSDMSAAEWLVINFGNSMVVTERGRWQDDSCAYLEADWYELFNVHSDSSYQVAESHFKVDCFAIDKADFFLENIEKNAHKKAAEVTKALRDTVRESVELLANEILESHFSESLESLAKYDFDDRKGREAAAQQVFEESLRFIYRMLFMFFTESQDERKGALPVQSRAYQMGYSIERLRDLEGVPMMGSDSHFIHETLHKAFGVYFGGYNKDQVREWDEGTESYRVKTDALGFAFPELGVDLFDPDKTPVFQEIWLSDGTMQKVIRKLSLAKVGTGKKTKTYRVHYAGLGLNQLGAVYEGLLSLKPVILEEKSIVLSKDKKEPAPRIVPFKQKSSVDSKLFAVDENNRTVTKEANTFVLTPVGLERKFSASYYTPEVLTRFLAKESVDNLLGDNPKLETMEQLKICEPAMGSGAFLNAVVDEIAPRMAKIYRRQDLKINEVYRKQCDKSGETYQKDKAPVYELYHYINKSKEHLMRHCVYGVDLNPTAVELAKISLWLNCIHEDGNLPFMDFKLKHGNSLIGCWIDRHHVTVAGKKMQHFLVPASRAIDPHIKACLLGDKKMPFLPKEEQKVLKDLQSSWQKDAKDKGIQSRIISLSTKVDELYQSHITARKNYRQDLEDAESVEDKKKVFERFEQENTAYNQLRLMMDYWCSLWFWPHQQLDQLPSLVQYLDAMEWMAETPLSYDYGSKVQAIETAGLSRVLSVLEVAHENRFFHWDLEYAEIFAEGGFDLVLGNPPWAPIRWEEQDFFEELKPGMHQVKADSKVKKGWYAKELEDDEQVVVDYKNAVVRTDGISNFLKGSGTYAFVDKSQTNTYRFFTQRFYQLACHKGTYGVIAQDGVFTDQGCLAFRKTALQELEYLYRFKNELRLFEDVHHEVFYMTAISQKGKSNNAFTLLDNLYHPQTLQHCVNENEFADYRGLKDEHGKWEVRGHPKRFVEVDEHVLKALAKFSDDGDWQTVKLPIIHGQIELEILTSLAEHSRKVRDIRCQYWRRFDESGAPKSGFITRKAGTPKTPSHAVMTGPNVFVGTPANKAPNIPCKNNLDFYSIDLTQTPDNFFPDTVYQCTEKGLKSPEYNTPTPWGTKHSEEFRIVARQMVSTTGARTLSTAIIPPGPSHVHAMVSLSFESFDILVNQSGLFNSLIFDFLMRSISGGTIGQGIYEMTPTLNEKQQDHPLTPALMIRALRLSCISTHYEDLWKETFQQDFKNVTIDSPFSPKLPYSKLTGNWKRDSCIRDLKEREQALCETDAIVAILFGFDKETLLNLYRSQFGVLQKNLQDLPNQEINEDKYHFPRYQQMSDAYDQLKAYLKSIGFKPKKVA